MSALTTIRFAPIRVSQACRVPLRFGIPFARGRAQSHQLADLVVADAGGARLPADWKVVSSWSDGSVRWALATLLLNSDAAAGGRLSLSWGTPADGADDSTRRAVRSDARSVVIEDERYTMRFGTEDGAPALEITNKSVSNADLLLRPEMFASCGKAVLFREGRFELQLCTDTRTEVIWRGTARLPDSARDVDLTLECVRHGQRALWEFAATVHNPSAARHPQGCWDLGDRGSVYFSRMSVRLTRVQSARALQDSSSATLRLGAAFQEQAVGSEWSLFQASSGGAAWDSPVHVDASGQVRLPFDGFRLQCAGELVEAGSRAEPSVRWRQGASDVCVAVPRFWQNFPSAIEATPDSVRVSLFPDQGDLIHELQAGEQKTQRLWLDADGIDDLHWVHTPPQALLDPDYIADSRAVPLFAPSAHRKELEQIVLGGMQGPDSFFAKREFIDEYGWRHFGDLYADHETLNYPGERPLVSHYNNQYDPIDSFWRQASRSKDARWHTLAIELADHVVDIDIYRTSEDRPEYNGGLFWHTDHYVHARTATHRTYSRRNTTSCDGEVGGGPGAEHCYTSGLTSLFFLTGDRRYQDAVLGLVQWMTTLHEGSGGLLEWVERFVRRELPMLFRAVRGRSGHQFRYPLTRGTGNYLNALLDGYLLTGDIAFVRRAGRVMRQTLHPAEQIHERDLLDVERCWSYLVLLQALCRLITVLRDDGLESDAADYAEACVLAFTDWMAEHERPFLDSAESLDFPNETWSAQDIRKAWLFMAASTLRPRDRDKMRAKAEEFEQVVVDGLAGSANSVHTRILILLLQSRPVDATLVASSQATSEQSLDALPEVRVRHEAKRLLGGLGRALRCLSPSREFQWLRFRLRDRLPYPGRGGNRVDS